MKNNRIIRQLAVLSAIVCAFSTMEVSAQGIIPTTAISNMPVATIEDMSLGREHFTVLNTITSSATVKSDNKKRSRKIVEGKGEFTMLYDIVKEDGKRYLNYEDCTGVIRLGYLGGSNIYNSESNYMPAEEVVRRLAIYRLISLAKESGADALFEPTITTTASSVKNQIVYKTEISAKIIKLKMD